MQMRDLIGYLAAMLFMAACGYFSAVWTFEAGLWLFEDTEWVRAIVGPISVFAGLAGMIGIPGLMAIAVLKIRGEG